MGLLVCSFVFLTLSEPAWVLSSPISLSETGHPKGSEFACLLRKVSQSDRGWKYSRDITELLSVKVLLLYCDTWGVAREHVNQMPPLTPRAAAPFPVPKTATPKHQPTSVLLCHPRGALKPVQHCKLQAQLSGTGETKNHLLCKHLFQACPPWLSASSVHSIIE